MAEVQAALSGAAAEGGDCMAEPVSLQRFGMDETRSVSLTYCDGRPNPDALVVLRDLARAELPVAGDESEAASEPAPALNPELLLRLQRLAAQFPGRAFAIVSGYRTRGRATSRHRSGDALDLRIAGVDNTELSAFARTLEATGVGYYPNSTFVHVDVRPSSAYWVDISPPGKAPAYVRPAPDPRLASVLLADAAESELHGAELPVAADEDDHADDPAPERDGAQTQSEGESETATAPASPAELDADLQQIAERALVVMRAAQSG